MAASAHLGNLGPSGVNEDGAVKELFLLICKLYKGRVRLSELEDALGGHKCQLYFGGSKPEVFFARHTRLFNIQREGDSWTLTTKHNIKYCSAYISKIGCKILSCKGLHLCRYYLLGTCHSEGACRFSHAFDDAHNMGIVHEYGVASWGSDELVMLIKLSNQREFIPSVCYYYNKDPGCTKGEQCFSIHMCMDFITGTCRQGNNCSRIHDIRSNQPLAIFKNFGIDTRQSNKELLGIIQQGLTAPSQRKAKPGSASDNVIPAPVINEDIMVQELMVFIRSSFKGSVLLPDLVKSMDGRKYSQYFGDSKPEIFFSKHGNVFAIQRDGKSSSWRITVKSQSGGNRAQSGGNRDQTGGIKPNIVVYCGDYVAKKGCRPTCRKMHLCRYYMMGTCRYNAGSTDEVGGQKCNYSHGLYDPHNSSILIENGVQSWNREQLTALIKQNSLRDFTPSICFSFNSSAGCTKGDKCPLLHVCRGYILGNNPCSKPCSYTHQLLTPQPIAVLQKFGYDTGKQPVTEILNRIRHGLGVTAPSTGKVEHPSTTQGHPGSAASPSKPGSGDRGKGRGAAGRGGQHDAGGRGRWGQRDAGGRGRGRGGNRGRGRGGQSQGRNMGDVVQSDQPPLSPTAVMDLQSVDDLMSFSDNEEESLLIQMEQPDMVPVQTEEPEFVPVQAEQPSSAVTAASKPSSKRVRSKQGKGGRGGQAEGRAMKDDPSAVSESIPDLMSMAIAEPTKQTPDITEICINSILGICHDGKCARYHYDVPYMWQKLCGNDDWECLSMEWNIAFEIEYCNVQQEKCEIRVDGVSNIVDFNKMILVDKSLKKVFPIRRISTMSTISNNTNPKLATEWIWYWKDADWSQYGQQGGIGSATIRSNDIEKAYQQFLEKSTAPILQFSVGLENEYVINFGQMNQTNQSTAKKREIRRRPRYLSVSDVTAIKQEKKSKGKKKKVPTATLR